MRLLFYMRYSGDLIEGMFTNVELVDRSQINEMAMLMLTSTPGTGKHSDPKQISLSFQTR